MPNTQVKFTIDTDIVSAFKNKCAREDVSMTSAVRRFMKTSKSSVIEEIKISTRQSRRKAVAEIVKMLNLILEAEESYRDSIPEAFSERYSTAESTCELISEVILNLEEAF